MQFISIRRTCIRTIHYLNSYQTQEIVTGKKPKTSGKKNEIFFSEFRGNLVIVSIFSVWSTHSSPSWAVTDPTSRHPKNRGEVSGGGLAGSLQKEGPSPNEVNNTLGEVNITLSEVNSHRWASTSISMSAISDIRHGHLLFRYRRQILYVGLKNVILISEVVRYRHQSSFRYPTLKKNK